MQKVGDYSISYSLPYINIASDLPDYASHTVDDFLLVVTSIYGYVPNTVSRFGGVTINPSISNYNASIGVITLAGVYGDVFGGGCYVTVTKVSIYLI